MSTPGNPRLYPAPAGDMAPPVQQHTSEATMRKPREERWRTDVIADALAIALIIAIMVIAASETFGF